MFHASVFVSFLLFGVILYSFLLAVLRQVWNGAFVRWVALGGAGFFLLHTANAETINYVIARADSFSTNMVVLAFVVYLCLPKLRRSLLYLVPIAVGALVKEPAVVFGPLLLVYLLLFREELSLADLVNLRAAMVSLGTVRNRSSSVTVPTRTMVLVPSVITFLSLTVSNLSGCGDFDSKSGAIVRGRAHTLS